MTYDGQEMNRLMYMTGVRAQDLSEMLDIPVWHVLRYLIFGDEKSGSPKERARLDTAVDMMRKCVKAGEYKFREEAIREVVKDEVLKREQKQNDTAVDIIMTILLTPDEDEFRCSDDPLYDCGLDRYGTKEFDRRVKERIGKWFVE